MKKMWKCLIIMMVVFTIISSSFVISVNAYVKNVGNNILTTDEATELEDVDCIVVPGCYVTADGKPGDVLQDRLDKAIELYKKGVAPKIIMSGDHSSNDYNEVSVMKQYAVDAGVPSEDIFMDHAGYSTYETVYRVKEVFNTNKVIIVSQEYYLYRAIYIAENLDIEAYGVASDFIMNEPREVFARCKDFVTSILKPIPANLGATYSVEGNGNITNNI